MLREQFLKRAFEEMCRHTKLKESFLRDNIDDLEWNFVCRFQNLSLSFIREFQYYMDWRELAQNETIHFTVDFIREFKDKLNWSKMSEREIFWNCDENIIEFNDKLDFVGLNPYTHKMKEEMLQLIPQKQKYS